MRKIVEFEVSGRAVPWKQPRGGYSKSKGRNVVWKDKDLTCWQDLIAGVAMTSMGDAEPSLCPRIGIRLVVFRETPAGCFDGQLCGAVVERADTRTGFSKRGKSLPDTDNLGKAVVDALEGIVFGNDAQVAGVCVSRVYGAEGVRVEVYALDLWDDWPFCLAVGVAA